MKIALIPVSGKPWHAGHDSLVKIAANECSEVRLFVSTSDRKRPGEIPIYGEDMKKIWDEYLEPSLPGNVSVTYGGSPVGNLYKELEGANLLKSSDTFVIYSDNEDILKYKDSTLYKSAPFLFQNGQIELRGVSRLETIPVSGTDMRTYIESGNIKKFIELLPISVQKNGREIYDILKKRLNPKNTFSI